MQSVVSWAQGTAAVSPHAHSVPLPVVISTASRAHAVIPNSARDDRSTRLHILSRFTSFLAFLSVHFFFVWLAFKSCQREKMSSSTASGVHTLNIRDTARIDVWDAHRMIGIEATSSSSSSSKPGGESPSASGTRLVQRLGTDSPPPSPTLPSSACEDDDSGAAAQRDLRISSPPQLQSIYGLWSTCACDVQDSRIPLPLMRSLDGDIFGVGKRPVQHEIETDGCVRLVFVEEPVD
ncbi:hypothetical protein EDB89DRAFT_574112 [Lactarius sanguifluus]|nr:hypothetical protein EDB89DRAFT_574112 [Lactarius sanguifluus]